MHRDLIIQVTARYTIPFILVLGAYIMSHGKYGAGGGFQGGVVIGTAFILSVISYGYDQARRDLSRRLSDWMSLLGALIFALVGLATLWAGGRFLEYTVLYPPAPIFINQVVIFLLEVAIGITVGGVIVTLFAEMLRGGQK
ncbi:MAG: MnhB domain-containing protein [Fimbriimonadales bacterium]